MKKIVAVLMAMVMVMSVTVALAGGTAAKDTQPENVVEYKKTLDIVMPEPVIETYGGYHVPRAHGYDFMTEPSVPMLPVKSFSLVIPQTAEIKSIKVVSSTKEELRGDYDIFPVQEPVPTSRDTTVRFTPKNPAIYASSNSYPGKLFEYAGEGNLRDYRILSIFVYPLQYNPAGKKLTFYKNINIEVTYTAPPSKSRETKQDEFALMVKALVSNPEDVDTLPTSTTEETSDILPTQNAEYVIITDSTFETEFQALADHKMSKGLSAEIVTVSWITNNYSGVDTQEKIRNFITDAKNTWNTKWVLLGGDTDIIPHRLAYSNFQGENEYIPADLYYSDLNGNWDADGDQIYGEVTDSIDFYPDVFVGRAPVDTIAEANTFVSKTIVYEGGPLGYEAKVLFLAEMLDSSTDGGIAKNIIDDNYIPDTFSVTKLYESLGNLNKVNAMNELNAGYGIVNHIGHGGVSVIGIGPDALYNADMDSLTNSPKNSIFYSISCHSNTFEQNSFSEHFVLNPDGGGIAYIGNSRYGWYISGSPNGPSDLYDREFFKSLFNEGFYHVGETLADSKITFVPASQSGDTVQRWIQYALNLLGDPETQIWIFIQSEHDISIEIVAAPNYLEPNETTLINSTIRNLGLNNETNIEVDFLVNGTEVDKTIIPFIEHGTSVLVSFPWEAPSTEGMYNLTVYAVPVPEENVTVNNQDTRVVLVKIRGEILIVSDDTASNNGGDGTSADEFEAVLNNMSYTYDLWNKSVYGTPSLSDLSKYPAVIWTCGDYYTGVVDSQSATNIENYLNNGGNIILEGGDIGYDHGDDTFMQNVAHATYKRDPLNNGNLYVNVLTTHPVTAGLPSSMYLAPYPGSKYPDVVTPVNGGGGLAGYEGELKDQYSLVVYDGWPSNLGRVVYMAFSVDGLDAKARLIENSINWVTNVTVNQPPVANANGPYNGTEDIAVTFDGSGSYDPDNDSLTYSWDFGDGSTGTGGSPNHTYTAGGTYNVTLIVNDGKVDSLPDTTTATITEVNDPPVADADGPYSGIEDIAVTFDGSGSYDPDNDSLTYSWDFGDGSTGTGVSPNHTYTAGWTYNVTLIVNDGKVDSLPDTTTATITEVNDPPIADADGPYSGIEDIAVTFDGSGSYDPDNDSLTYSWDFGDGSTGTGVSPNHTYTAGWTYNVTLIVNDGELDSLPDTTTATITEVNDPPVADADGPYSGIEDIAVTFNGSGSYDPDGDPLTYHWDFGDASTGTGVNPTHIYKAAGTYTVALTVTDNGGSTDNDTAIVNVSVSGHIDEVTNADIPVKGMVTGSYLDTHVSDNVCESITEIVRGPRSLMEHKWTIDVTGGSSVTFYVEAYHTDNSENDNFEFAYSTDDSTYTDMVTVTNTSDTDTYQTYKMPKDTSGTVYIRVMDTDRTKGNRALDTIYIDHVFIRSVSGAPSYGVSVTIEPTSQTVAPGNSTTYAATVTNTGDLNASYNVTMSGTAVVNETITVIPLNWSTGMLTPGDKTATTVTVSTSSTPEETYTLTATATCEQDASVNDSATSELAVSSETNTMHVYNISMRYTTAGPNYKIYTKVKIVDSSDVAVAGATVYLNTTLPGGTNVSSSGDTVDDGTVEFKYGPTKTPGNYTSTVTNVIKDGWTYDPDVGETSNSITV